MENSQQKHGIEHYLHKQWINTKSGREQHAEDCKRMRELPIAPRVIKCKRTTNPWEVLSSSKGGDDS
jgi:hypothetical protein